MDPSAPNEQQDENKLVPPSDSVDGPQPTKAPEATYNAAENQPEKDTHTDKFTWRIENFSRFSENIQSGIYELGDHKWRILVFLNEDNAAHLSIYLVVADAATLPYGWSRDVHFSLSVVSQVDSKYSVRQGTHHLFNAGSSGWGFNFIPLSELYDTSRGYLVNDTCVLEVEVDNETMDYLNDAKKETGFVGLKNQGATCYMNSLLQTLFHIPNFRKVVYHMPTNENDTPSTSISLALQILFYKLQYGEDSVATEELTTSFGWDPDEASQQHDVQEFNRVLCEKLEEKMKCTFMEGSIQLLFEGNQMNYIKCINVDCESTRKESFYDLQLDVKGCEDVYASFDKYVAVEHLDGDNKYRAGQHGLQDAKKGVLFIDFPPVLQLHLKRFEYDLVRNVMFKINDRYEFPLQLDLDRDDGKYLSPEADRKVRNLYTLHSVLVHSGGVNGGHYYAFISPTLSSTWYKFDDENVTKEDMGNSLKELFGGGRDSPRQANAYMLMYIRESDKDKIICHVDEMDIAEHLRERLKREQEEKEQKKRQKKREKEEEHLYTNVKVACEDDFVKQIGRDVIFDLVDLKKVKNFRVQKLMPFIIFKEEVAKAWDIPVHFQRFWLWTKHYEISYRPNCPVTQLDEALTVGDFILQSNNIRNAELKLFLEFERGMDSQPIPLPNKTEDDILLFFKLYDPENEELRYAGKLFVKDSDTPTDILTKLNEMAGYDSDEEIDLYEEVAPSLMCKPIDKQSTFESSTLHDGHIVCYQKTLSALTRKQHRLPDVISFFDYHQSLQVIHFRPLRDPKDHGFCLRMSKIDTYDEVVHKVACHLNVKDPAEIRLTSHLPNTQRPKFRHIKYRGVHNLRDMLLHHNQISDILYYEVLDMPLWYLEDYKTLKIAFHNATNNGVVIHYIRLPKKSTIGDVLEHLGMQVKKSHPKAELRLMQVLDHTIHKIFSHDQCIKPINTDYWPLRAEEIPVEEINLGPQDLLIHVYHFRSEKYQNKLHIKNFGEPFLMVIHRNEVFAHIKIRIQRKLNVPGEEFSKWKFAIILQFEAKYLKDSDILFTLFQKSSKYSTWKQYLGLEHLQHTSISSIPPSQNLSPRPRHPPREKAIKIRN